MTPNVRSFCILLIQCVFGLFPSLSFLTLKFPLTCNSFGHDYNEESAIQPLTFSLVRTWVNSWWNEGSNWDILVLIEPICFFFSPHRPKLQTLSVCVCHSLWIPQIFLFLFQSADSHYCVHLAWHVQILLYFHQFNWYFLLQRHNFCFPKAHIWNKG